MLRTIDSILKNQGVSDGASPGKFRIVGEDRWDHSRFVVEEHDTAAEALSKARAYTLEDAGGASDPSIATVYEVYDDEGRYLGGEQPLRDWWKAKRLEIPVIGREAVVAEHFELQPLLNRAGTSRIEMGDFDRASGVCREAAASLGWEIRAIDVFGAPDTSLPTHVVQCRTTTEPAADVEFRLAEVWGTINVEIQAFIVLRDAPEPLLEKLTTIVQDARQAV